MSWSILKRWILVGHVHYTRIGRMIRSLVSTIPYFRIAWNGACFQALLHSILLYSFWLTTYNDHDDIDQNCSDMSHSLNVKYSYESWRIPSNNITLLLLIWQNSSKYQPVLYVARHTLTASTKLLFDKTFCNKFYAIVFFGNEETFGHSFGLFVTTVTVLTQNQTYNYSWNTQQRQMHINGLK